ncbi:hypothetical protein Aduo_007693 [Ancylostoma duodenale]
MVSSIPKCFRPRRDRPENKKKLSQLSPSVDIGAVVEIPSSSTDTESELIAAAEEESSQPTVTMSPGATAVQDVVLERHEETKLDESAANGKPTVVETSEVVDSCGCPVNLKAVKDAVKDMPEEYKEAARTSSLVFASLVGLFFSIVLYRYLRHLYMPEPEGFFCQ